MIPTPRLLAVLLVPGVLLAAANLVPDFLLVAAAAWLLALGLIGAEWRLLGAGPCVRSFPPGAAGVGLLTRFLSGAGGRTRASGGCVLSPRRRGPRLSLGAENVIWLDLDSRAPRTLAVTLRDETPASCFASA